MREKPDASSSSPQGNNPQSDQYSPTAAGQALGRATADAAASALTAPASTAISLSVNGDQNRL
jgi:hypothetical protein